MKSSTQPKVQIRYGVDRGRTRISWLDSYHSFSFGDYYDPAHMGFGDLRVINEDVVEPGQGFATHGHRDMEIITYILEGELEHKDSLGNGSVIRPGDVQRMTAGSGIRHSEFNPSDKTPVHLLQIWILPSQKGLEPGYEQKRIVNPDLKNQWQLLASPNGRDGSVSLNQDVQLYTVLLETNEEIPYSLNPGRNAWLQVAKGQVQLNDEVLSAGDGVAVTTAIALAIKGLTDDSEVLLFDLQS